MLYHSIIFVSSYFDYVKLWKYFSENNSSMSFINEHTEDVDCVKERNKFEYEKNRFLLVSERAIVFGKVDLWYAKNIIFYSLPESIEITKQMIHLLNPKSGQAIWELMESWEKKWQ